MTKKLLIDFEKYMSENGKSKNTINSYKIHIRNYISWYEETYSLKFDRLYKENILEYKSYLMNIKKFKGKKISGKTINAKLSAILVFNKFLIYKNFQDNMVVRDDDFIKIQTNYANPTDISKQEVDNFRQLILKRGDKRLYALVTLLAYTGLRISEALNLKIGDINLESKELVVRDGKGGKQRVVFLNSKVVESLKEYFKVRNSKSEYIFSSRQSEKLNRTVVNKLFKKYNNKITPHKLRHFFCTNALESGFAVHEVANLAGHRSIQTTMIYTNPSREQMKNKMEML